MNLGGQTIKILFLLLKKRKRPWKQATYLIHPSNDLILLFDLNYFF